ncbi:MAG: hypoxanthine phosphoribosyltransferase, partial [Bacillota bacterium]
MKEESIFADDIVEIIISEKEIQERIKELASSITQIYKKNKEIIMVCILRGAAIFMADLARHVNLSV